MKNETRSAAAPQTAAFFSMIESATKFRLFLLRNLPTAFFSGLRIREISEERCSVSVPYNWFTQNPFRSTYFASLSMAAEMSTGALAMAQLYRRRPAASQLLTGMEAKFHKKATGVIVFTCADGNLIKDAVCQAYATNQPQAVRVTSEGRNGAGERVATFWFEWSFKVRSQTVG